MIVSGPSRRPASPEELLGPSLAAQLDRLDLRSRRLFPGKLPGERRSKKRGQSVEFAEHRQYAPGDDPRFIDWNALARLDRLFVKVFMEEEDLSVHLVLDASASMETPPASSDPGTELAEPGGPLGLNKKLFAARLGAALGYVALCNQNRVGVTVFGASSRPAVMPDARGSLNVQRLLRFIRENMWPEAGEEAADAPADAGALKRALDLVAASRSGKGVIVVVSDFFCAEPGGFEPALRSLTSVAGSGGFDVYCVHTLAPAELDPSLLGRGGAGTLAGDLRLTDAESGRVTEVTVTAPLLRRYKEKLDAFCAALKGHCSSRGVNYTLVRTDERLSELMARTLRLAGLLD